MTIKNIIFDVGNVLLRWDPQWIARQAFPVHNDVTDLAHALFKHQTWFDLNLGIITEKEALKRYHSQLGLDLDDLEKMMDIVRASLIPLPGSLELLNTLNTHRFNLYALTDNTHDIMKYLKQKYDFWPLFQGVVVSAEVGHLKPSRAIYDHLLTTYQIAASCSVFIDDAPQNIEGAKAVGMQGILFKDAKQCIEALQALKIKI